jgi:hypothetical protein
MINTNPLKEYLQSQDAIRSGNNIKALELLTKSIGSDTPSKFIKENLTKLIKEPNEAILTLVINQTKGEYHGR